MSLAERVPPPLVAGVRHPYLRPVDAATLILLDSSARRPRVLLGRRHQRHVFLPGRLVFPGGRVDPGDRTMPVFGALDPESERRLLARVLRPSLVRARALALAAIRETYEETGLMLGDRDVGAPPARSGSWSAFSQAGVFPSLEAVSFVARAITPPGRSRRFDTRFFLADLGAVAHRVEGMVGPDTELVELVWATLPEALATELPSITRAVLQDLDERLAAGNHPRLPVPFYFARGSRFHREMLD